MQKILPETELEQRLLCYGAPFIEENNVLDEILQVLDLDILENKKLSDDDRENALREIGEYFFRLDMNYGREIKADCIEILSEFWKVTDRESAQNVLEDIRHKGHRTKFNVLKGSIPDQGPIYTHSIEKFKTIFNFDLEESQQAGLSDDEFRRLADWFQKTYKHVGEEGILAWDLARAVHLVRLAFVADYLSDIQAWSEILKLAPLAEGQFKDWMSFSKSFLIGRTFWSGHDDPRMKASCEKLLGHPASPWEFISSR